MYSTTIVGPMITLSFILNMKRAIFFLKSLRHITVPFSKKFYSCLAIQECERSFMSLVMSNLGYLLTGSLIISVLSVVIHYSISLQVSLNLPSKKFATRSSPGKFPHYHNIQSLLFISHTIIKIKS